MTSGAAIRTGGVLWLSLAATLAAAAPRDEWKTWLDARAAAFSGAVLIARGDAIQFAGAYGLADRDSGRRNTPETRFNLGSINKTFTAIAVAQLVQQRRLALDDTLAKYIPDYPRREAAANITIQQLLTHRGGIAPFVRADFGEASVAEMVKAVAAEPQLFEPGTRQQYSNGGYVLLGRVVEVASGKDYETYIADHVYGPAGMTASGFVKRGDASVARGYFATDAEGRPLMGGRTGTFGFTPPRRGNPAGGGYSTVTDLFRFARALGGGRLLDQRMTDYMTTGVFSGRASGFGLREQLSGTRRFVGNGGGAPGVNAEFRFEPAGDFTVVVLSNSSPPAATQLLTAILERLSSEIEPNLLEHRGEPGVETQPRVHRLEAQVEQIIRD
jgi:D-alanyl-D-alanine carboxypeptidase